VVKWPVVFTEQAQKDAKKLASAGLKHKALFLIDILKENPLKVHPPYEKIIGDLLGAYSRRINIQHRLIYQVLHKERIVKVIRMWIHEE
jgi:toxin YoeB